ncbi:MAG: hypothetical protein IJF33_05250 [Clostridia bacterium]|nr:hypothetical protein [Clostridia bacterium]
MLKSVKYRSDAKLILGLGLLLCALACAAYGILMIPEVKGIKFQWEYLAIIGGAALLFVLVSIHLFCRAAAWARKERKEEAVQENNLDLAVESDDESALMEGAIMIQVPASVDCKAGVSSKVKLPEKINMETVKKVGMVAVPIVAACAVVAALSSNSKYKKQAKRRKQFYRWLG